MRGRRRQGSRHRTDFYWQPFGEGLTAAAAAANLFHDFPSDECTEKKKTQYALAAYFNGYGEISSF